MNYALILAGGTGSRAGGSLPKQFQMGGNDRIIWKSVKAFKRFDPDCVVVLVVHPYFLERWSEIFGEEEKALGFDIHKTVGGSSRIRSVKNGLDYIGEMLGSQDSKAAKGKTDTDPVVFIHDSARPAVTPELIERGRSAVDKGAGAVPTVPVVDSLRLKTQEGTKSVDRSDYLAVQTPQIFLYSDIKKAYEAIEDEEKFTDDASVAENVGIRILSFQGDPANIKITNPIDFKLI